MANVEVELASAPLTLMYEPYPLDEEVRRTLLRPPIDLYLDPTFSPPRGGVRGRLRRAVAAHAWGQQAKQQGVWAPVWGARYARQGAYTTLAWAAHAGSGSHRRAPWSLAYLLPHLGGQ